MYKVARVEMVLFVAAINMAGCANVNRAHNLLLEQQVGLAERIEIAGEQGWPAVVECVLRDLEKGFNDDNALSKRLVSSSQPSVRAYAIMLVVRNSTLDAFHVLEATSKDNSVNYYMTTNAEMSRQAASILNIKRSPNPTESDSHRVDEWIKNGPS